MGANHEVLQVVSGWLAVELVLKCIFAGLWQIMQIAVKRLWKGHRRKSSKNSAPVELSVDSSIGTHCYIKIMGVKYHYVETGPKSGQLVLILGDAPDAGHLWCPNWCNVVRRLAESGYHVITLDLRGTGGSEGGCRNDLSPPRAVEELSTLVKALGVSERRPAVIIGFGIGGMLTWYLVHCYSKLISKFAVIGAPHPNLYWQYPPTAFCQKALHFIQWPCLPEKWLAEGELQENEEGRWTSSRACDWTGALNYIRGAAWWQIKPSSRAFPPALLVGSRGEAAQLVSSAQHCACSTLRLVENPTPEDPDLPAVMLEFLVAKEKEKPIEDVPKTLMGRMLGAVAGRGRELTARLVLQPAQA
ncbi:AB hydrolase superfamily protein YfhM-like [Manduca sexta]|uniref:AB hydrolase superfamily protein YfhM-like n=1 Tax=Manduca sexta TaxID=7130 RepID=UPI00118280EE|nr:AB hydrolase superfamily protein YfhM-like [Manduca sexta]